MATITTKKVIANGIGVNTEKTPAAVATPFALKSQKQTERMPKNSRKTNHHMNNR